MGWTPGGGRPLYPVGVLPQLAALADDLEREGGPKYVKVPDVAKDLGVSRATIQRLCRLGRRVGRDYLISRAEVEALKAQRGQG